MPQYLRIVSALQSALAVRLNLKALHQQQLRTEYVQHYHQFASRPHIFNQLRLLPQRIEFVAKQPFAHQANTKL